MELSFKDLTDVICQAVQPPAKPCPYEVGKSYLIRTVTFTSLGRVRKIVGDTLVLEDASWVAETGVYSVTLKKGGENISELEPYPGEGICYVNMGAIADAAPWPHDLPREQK